MATPFYAELETKFQLLLRNWNGWVTCRRPVFMATIRAVGWMRIRRLRRPHGAAKWRVLAEADWQALADEVGLPLHIFRLAGIYGPGRGPFAKVREGTARRIIKKDQVFSRIHVADIAQVLAASIAQPNPGRIYNRLR